MKDLEESNVISELRACEACQRVLMLTENEIGQLGIQMGSFLAWSALSGSRPFNKRLQGGDQ